LSEGQAAFSHHFDKVAQTELLAQIPPHAKDDDFAVEMTPVEQPFEFFQLARWLVVVKSSKVTDRRAEIALQPIFVRSRFDCKQGCHRQGLKSAK
jgi:hypothetical protein